MIEINELSVKYIQEYSTLMNVTAKFDKNTLIIGNKNDGTHSLFRTLAKIDREYTGQILIDGINLNNIKDTKLSIAYVPSEPYLFKRRSLFYNLSYPLSIRNTKDQKSIVDKYIAKYLSTFPNQIKQMNYSQKKITALVRAMIRKPKYILIEDLFLSLDDRYIALACSIINEISYNSIIIASESKNQSIYTNFEQYLLSYGSLTKL